MQIELISSLLGDLRRGQVPESCLLSLDTLRDQAIKRDPEWFNVAENYLDGTSATLQAQKGVFD